INGAERTSCGFQSRYDSRSADADGAAQFACGQRCSDLRAPQYRVNLQAGLYGWGQCGRHAVLRFFFLAGQPVAAVGQVVSGWTKIDMDFPGASVRTRNGCDYGY